jgi:nucleotide-binding universal stress UspA family protein
LYASGSGQVVFRKLLVPLDGSPLAERALASIELFRGAGAESVTVVRVLMRNEPETEAVTYLADVATRLRAEGFEVEICSPQGDVADEILAEAQRRDVDLIAMSTHGRSGLGRWVYGSVAEAVLARTPVPVVLTRAWHARDAPHGVPPRVLVPLDGSAFGESALSVAVPFASSPLAAEIVLLRVVLPARHLLTSWAPGVVYSELGTESDQEDAATYLHGVAERLAREEQVPASRIAVEVRVGLPAETIVDTANERGCALVAMATHGRSGISRAVLGSVTNAVLRLGSTPLLVVRPHTGGV